MELLYIAFVFFVFALFLTVLGPKLGIDGGEMAYKISILFVILTVALFIFSLLFGGGFSGGFGHTFTI